MRKQLQLTITAPYDPCKLYLSDLYLTALKDYVQYMEDCGRNVPRNGVHVADEAIIRWMIYDID